MLNNKKDYSVAYKLTLKGIMAITTFSDDDVENYAKQEIKNMIAHSSISNYFNISDDDIKIKYVEL